MKIKTLNNILDNKKISLTTKSISAFHIVKLHSLFIKKKFSVINIIYKIFKKILVIIFIFNDFFKKKYNKKIPNKKILIISHLINKKHLNSKDDFYYGNFENILKKFNKSYYKLMINHTDINSSYLNLKNRNKNSFILDKNLNFEYECKIIFKKIISLFELFFLFFCRKLSFKNFFLLITSLFDSTTSFSLRINYQIKDFIKSVNPRFCILTYEGYSWERMCINGVKSVDEKIECIGYQHTPVTHHHRAIFNYMNGNFNPDKIWCSQINSYKILRKKIYKKLKKKILFVGNFKKNTIKKSKIYNSKSFLVIPEGIYSECDILFRFSLRLARQFKNLSFIWRVHPVINFKKVLNDLNIKKNNLPKNILISSKKFEEDVLRCKYVIYTGSAAVIKSVLMGNYPIYFHSDNEKNFDPLIAFFGDKNYVNNEKSFLNLLKRIEYKSYKKDFRKKVLSLKNDSFSNPDVKKIINSFKSR